MKQLYTLRRTLSAITLLLVSAISCMAIEFEVDGIKYSVNKDMATVEEAQGSYSGDIVIPSTVTHDGITYSVTSIGDHAFYGCEALNSISIPNGVTSIGYAVLVGCSSLTSITVSSDNTVYDSREGCNALIETSTNTLIAGCQSTVIPESVTSIGEVAFYYCTSLTSISIPEGVTSIGSGAFGSCSSLTSITVSPDNTVYDSREGCNALIETSTNTLIAACQSTIIPESVTRIGDGAFRSCTSITSITIPKSVTSIGRYAFEHCTSLTSIDIPKGVTSIGEYAFNGCTSLASIDIPEGVTSIGLSALQNCISLTTIVCRANEVPELENDAFSDVPQSEATLYVPSSSIEAYRAADQWKYFGKILPLEEYITGIASTTAGSEDTGVYDVYTIRGTLIRKGCNLNGLPAGAYILRHGNESKTVVIR